MSGASFIKHYLKDFKKQLIIIIISVFVYVALTLISPLIFSFVIDHLILLEPIVDPITKSVTNYLGGVDYLRDNLWIGFMAIIGINVFIGIFNFTKGKYNAIVSEKVVERIRNDLFSHLQFLPYTFHQENKSGELVQKCTSDVEQIRKFVASQISEMVYCVAMSIVALFILFLINPTLMFFSSLSIPLLFVLAVWFFSKTQKTFLESDESEGRLIDNIQENLMGIRVVKAFNKEIYETERFEKHNDDFTYNTFRVIKLLGTYYSITDFIVWIQVLTTIILGIYFNSIGDLSMGNFFVFLTYELMILWPARQLGRIVSDMGKMFVSSKRLADIVYLETEDLNKGKVVNFSDVITFKDVSFKFSDGEKNALRNISLQIKPGESVALMGPIGSGKSTLVHLLSRLYDVSEGSITIGDTNINEIAKGELRKNIGIVLQEPFLFSKTIGENIMISTTLNSEKMKDAARVANVHQVIEGFEMGYQTMVGERGVTLSGGQKQRISIARVIINDVKILIFDDSLSAVDSETDTKIRKALNELSKDLTTIIITHRYESAKNADKIIVLEKGVITQLGKHSDLINEDGFYQKIYKLQNLRGDK